MAIYVPERKVWTRQPPSEVMVNWSNPVANGLVFAFNAGSGLVDLVSQRPLTVAGAVAKQGDTDGTGVYTAASSDVAYGILGQSIPTTGSVAVFELCKVNNTNVTRKRSLRLAGATGTVLSHDYSEGSNAYDFVGYQDSSSVFPNSYYSSYASGQLYANYISHTTGDAQPVFDRSGTPATSSNITGNGTRKEAITSVYIGNSSSGFPLTGLSYLCLVFNRSLSKAEQVSLRGNPWQIFSPAKKYFSFTPKTQPIYVPERKVWTSQPPNVGSINWNNPLNDNLIFCAPLGSINRDIVGGRIITRGSGASLGTDYKGESLRASGSAAVASVPVNLSPYTAITVSFWMYWDSFANNDKLALEYTPNFTSANGFLIDPNSASPAAGFVQTGVARPSFYNVVRFNRPTAATWHHYVFAFDRMTGTAASTAVWVDGIPQSVTVISGSSSVGNNFADSTLYLFSRNNSSLYGAGRMQNLCIRAGVSNAAYIADSEYNNPWQIFSPARRWFSLAPPNPLVTRQLPGFSVTSDTTKDRQVPGYFISVIKALPSYQSKIYRSGVWTSVPIKRYNGTQWINITARPSI